MEALGAPGVVLAVVAIVFVLILIVLSILMPIFVYLINARVKDILKEVRDSNRKMDELVKNLIKE